MVTQDIASEQKSYSSLRVVADMLTLLRLATAVFIVVLGMAVGPRALKAAIIATFCGWLTDSVDGHIARSSRTSKTWVSHLDFAVDITLAYSFFLFVVVTGLFPLVPAILLVGVGTFVVLKRPTESVIQIVTAPIFGLPVVLSFHAGPVVGICYCVFLLTLAIFRWDHLVSDASNARREAGALAGVEENA